MKVIIKESRLKNIMFDYFNNTLEPDMLKSSHGMEFDVYGYEYEDTNATVFYKHGDMFEDEDVFRYYECDYFSKDATHIRTKCPILTLDRKYSINFSSYFGDTWQGYFKEWVGKVFNLHPNTIYVGDF